MDITAFYETLLQNLNEGVLILKETGEVKYANMIVEEHLGYPPERLIGSSFLKLLDEKDAAYFNRRLQDAVERKLPSFSMQLKLRTHKGRWVLCSLHLRNCLALAVVHGFIVSVFPLEAAEGRSTDAQNKQAETSKHAAPYERLRLLIERNEQASVLLNEKTQVMAANAAALELTRKVIGRPLQEHITLLRYLPTTEHERFRHLHEQSMRGYSGDMTFPKGKYLIKLDLMPIWAASGEVVAVMVYIKEVSREAQLRQELVYQHRLLEALDRASSEMLILIDEQLKIRWFNRQAVKMALLFFGKELKLGTDWASLVQLNDEEKENYLQQLKENFRGESYFQEAKIADIHGGAHWLQLTYTPMEVDERNMIIISALDITKERAAKKRLAALNRQLIEQNKELARQEAAARMMNEQLRNQQKQLKHAFEELSRRNFELDQFLYKVAHDIRAPITSLKGLVHLMEQEGIAPELQGYLDHMKGSIRRLDGFIRNMYTYASIEQKPLSFEPLDFEAMLAEIAYELKEALHERKIILDYKILGKQQSFAGDKVRLYTILHNIISNSIQYVDEKKERHEVKVEVQLLPRLAKLKIEDNGSGIDLHLQDKVFDMFFRGDERSKGAGLGLYIVKQIIEQLQGKIELKSKPGEGTSIEIEIPNQVSTN